MKINENLGSLKALIRRFSVLAGPSFVCSLLIFGLSGTLAMAQTPMGTYFTYQGRLEESGEPATGTYDFRFNIYWEGDCRQTAICEFTEYDVPVRDGIFYVKVDCDSSVFSSGENRWLGIEVRPAAPGPYTTLLPCQEVTATPYSLHSGNADHLDGLDSTDFDIDQVTPPEAKNPGTLLVGNGSNVVPLPVGNDEDVLVADSTAGVGLKWDDVDNVMQGGVPAGAIIMWSGPIDVIPPGWHLCDGTDGTPDLRDRFIVGAGSQYEIGDMGGQDAVQLSVTQIPIHDHTYSDVFFSENPNFPQCNGSGVHDNLGSASSDYDNTGCERRGISDPAGGDQAHENRPPFYALAYIMKI